jgi:hypothetical protein
VCTTRADLELQSSISQVAMTTSMNHQARLCNLLLSVLYFCGAGDGTQGFVHVRQVFYHRVISPVLCSIYCFNILFTISKVEKYLCSLLRSAVSVWCKHYIMACYCTSLHNFMFSYLMLKSANMDVVKPQKSTNITNQS